MSIDLDTTKGRKEYLSEKFDDLLDGINESYGTVLMEELLKRLEITIKDFNDEMKALCDHLVKKQDERLQLLEMLKSNEDISAKMVSKEPTSGESEDAVPVWEKKLSQLEKKLK